MTARDNIENKLNELAEAIGEDNALVENVMSRIEAVPIAQAEKNFKNKLFVRRFIMNRFTKLAAAAIIIIAAIFSITIFDKTMPTASAAAILAEAVEAVSNFQSVYIKARMRTLPADNFSMIGLDYDFVPINLWKKVDDAGLVKWKVEKPGRLLVTDGNSTTFFIKPNYVEKSKPSSRIGGYDCGWFGRVVNVKNLLENEYKYVRQASNAELLVWHDTIDGREKIILEVDVLAQGGYKNDYLKNKFIFESDHTKIYRFDTETKLLESFEIIVHTDQKDVLIFETTEIEYDPQIDDEVFALDLPDDIITFKKPEILPDNERYEQMTPKEAAATFFQACADEDWEEFLKFWYVSAVSERAKQNLGGLEIISLGEPFQSGRYSGWFVPYEIKLKNGQIRKHNLALRNDNKAKRFEVDGGL